MVENHRKGCKCMACVNARKKQEKYMKSTMTPAAHCAKDFSFAQCTVCKKLYQVSQRGRLPHCDDVVCGCRLERVKYIASPEKVGS